MKAIWNGAVVAESRVTELIDGCHYFPKAGVNSEYLRSSVTQRVCPWKGTARYFTIVVDGKENRDAAWWYPEPTDEAASVSGHVAFWNGVHVIP